MTHDTTSEPTAPADKGAAADRPGTPLPDDVPCNAAESGSGSGLAPDPKPAQEAEPTLPPLTPQEFRIYNRLAEQMDYFHDHFRQMYSTLHTACTNNRRPANMTLKQFLDEGIRLARYLDMHHSIEETHLYPLLGRKMPEFRATAPPSGGGPSSGKGGKKGSGKGARKEECELLRQHRLIHEGVDEMADYLRRCKDRECELELGVLKGKLDSWGPVLLQHLDEEVRDLGAEKMRRYWTVQEVEAFPM